MNHGGRKDSIVSNCFQPVNGSASRWPSGLTRSQIIVKVGESMFSNSGREVKVNSPERSLIQYPWGMHICDYQQTRLRGNRPKDKNANSAR